MKYILFMAAIIGGIWYVESDNMPKEDQRLVHQTNLKIEHICAKHDHDCATLIGKIHSR